MHDAISETNVSDPNWQYLDLEAQRAQIPDSENSALVLQAGKKLLPSNTFLSKHFEAMEDLFEYPATIANEAQKTALIDYLELYSPALVEYRKLKDMPRGRFPITIAPDIVSTSNLHIIDVHAGVVALQYLAYDRIVAGDASGAVHAIIAAFNAARSIGDEQNWGSIKGRIVFAVIPINALERLLAQVKVDETDLSKIQSIVESELQELLFLRAVRGFRAFSFACLENMKKHPIQAGLSSRATRRWGSRWVDWEICVPGVVAKAQAEMLRYLNEAVRIAERPYEGHIDAYANWSKRKSELSELAQRMSPGGLFVEDYLVHQARLRCVLVAIAAERYRMHHDSWPETVENLVAAKLIPAAPLDPFDGRPLRWKTVTDGRIIYSIGRNKVDDDGNIQRVIVNNDDHSDIVVRLFDLDKRRQPPRPVKPNEPKEKEKSNPVEAP